MCPTRAAACTARPALAAVFPLARRGPRSYYVCMITVDRYMTRKPPADRRHVWRQKVRIVGEDGTTTFYVDFGEYTDGRLAEIFVTSHRSGTFVRGVLDSLARSASLALQSGTSPHELARTLCGQCYPPCGKVVAEGSMVTECSSIADYIGQEIIAIYGEDGYRR